MMKTKIHFKVCRVCCCANTGVLLNLWEEYKENAENFASIFGVDVSIF